MCGAAGPTISGQPHTGRAGTGWREGSPARACPCAGSQVPLPPEIRVCCSVCVCGPAVGRPDALEISAHSENTEHKPGPGSDGFGAGPAVGRPSAGASNAGRFLGSPQTPSKAAPARSRTSAAPKSTASLRSPLVSAGSQPTPDAAKGRGSTRRSAAVSGPRPSP